MAMHQILAAQRLIRFEVLRAHLCLFGFGDLAEPGRVSLGLRCDDAAGDATRMVDRQTANPRGA